VIGMPLTCHQPGIVAVAHGHSRQVGSGAAEVTERDPLDPAWDPITDYDRLTIASPTDDCCAHNNRLWTGTSACSPVKLAALDTFASKVIAHLASRCPPGCRSAR